MVDEDPLLGLRLMLEGLARIPENAQNDRNAIAGEIGDMATLGRIRKVDRIEGDGITIHPEPAGNHFFLDYGNISYGQPSKLYLYHVADSSYTDFSRDFSAGINSGQVFSPDGTYFMLSYFKLNDRLSELRRTADGFLIETLTGDSVFVFSSDSNYGSCGVSAIATRYSGVLQKGQKDDNLQDQGKAAGKSDPSSVNH
ncbi:MAG: hypothetical protein HC875_41630, partial [Anaerolineales bacterium]|nr:hypothetical protein [Anaerolineales bacterium]